MYRSALDPLIPHELQYLGFPSAVWSLFPPSVTHQLTDGDLTYTKLGTPCGQLWPLLVRIVLLIFVAL